MACRFFEDALLDLYSDYFKNKLTEDAEQVPAKRAARATTDDENFIISDTVPASLLA